jgi:hypothetical protein
VGLIRKVVEDDDLDINNKKKKNKNPIQPKLTILDRAKTLSFINGQSKKFD